MGTYEEILQLENDGIDLVEILGQDRPLESPTVLTEILGRLQRSGDDLHSELLHALTLRRFPAEEAVKHWQGIMDHRATLTVALGRQVRFRVAALDYFSEAVPELQQVRLVAKAELDGLQSYVDIDALTGIHNRRYFNGALVSEVRRSRRYGWPLTLLLVDLDAFHEINEDFGHESGDSVLRSIGRECQKNLRSSDHLCRFGGDVFALILPETSVTDAQNVAERTLSIVRRVGRSLADDVDLGASIGGASYPDDGDDAEELTALSDQYCRDAKEAGGRRTMLPDGGFDAPMAARG